MKEHEIPIQSAAEQNKAGQEKITVYKEMLGNAEAVFVLSASAKKIGEGKNERYRPDSYGDRDNHGSMGGGHARVIAAAEIAQYFPDIKIVTDSYDYSDEPTLAKTYADALKGLGVSENRIILEERSNNTLTELLEMVKMAKNHNWQRVAVLTGELHLGRVRAMIANLEKLAKKLHPEDKNFFTAWEHFKQGQELQINILEAEKILPLRDGRYNKIIKYMRNNSAYKQTIEAETNGIRQINDGTYGQTK